MKNPKNSIIFYTRFIGQGIWKKLSWTVCIPTQSAWQSTRVARAGHTFRMTSSLTCLVSLWAQREAGLSWNALLWVTAELLLRLSSCIGELPQENKRPAKSSLASWGEMKHWKPREGIISLLSQIAKPGLTMKDFYLEHVDKYKNRVPGKTLEVASLTFRAWYICGDLVHDKDSIWTHWRQWPAMGKWWWRHHLAIIWKG